jgi:hypothetical protein
LTNCLLEYDQDVLMRKQTLENITKKIPRADAVLKGTINLANVSKAYPIIRKPLTEF